MKYRCLLNTLRTRFNKQAVSTFKHFHLALSLYSIPIGYAVLLHIQCFSCFNLKYLRRIPIDSIYDATYSEFAQIIEFNFVSFNNIKKETNFRKEESEFSKEDKDWINNINSICMDIINDDITFQRAKAQLEVKINVIIYPSTFLLTAPKEESFHNSS